MATGVFVEGVDDPRLADYRALTDVSLRRRTEPEHGIFIAEGELVISRALLAGYPMRSALMSDAGCRRSPTWSRRRRAAVHRVGGTARGGHRLSCAPRRVGRDGAAAVADVAELLPSCERVVVLEEVNSHTNIGAIFRCAAALGMDAVFLSPTCADPLYRRSVRVSMGEVFAIPYARFASGRTISAC